MSTLTANIRPRPTAADLAEMKERIEDTEAMLEGMRRSYDEILAAKDLQLYDDGQLLDVIAQRVIEDESQPAVDYME